MIHLQHWFMPATAKRGSRWKSNSVMLLLLAILMTSGCATQKWASVRKSPSNPLEGPLQLMSYGGPKVTDRTRQSLRVLGLEKYADGSYEKGLTELAEIIEREPTADNLYTYAELSYIAASRADAMGKNATALELYAGSVSHAYYFLFECKDGVTADGYDPRFRQACDIYNKSLEGSLRLVKAQGRLKQGETYRIKTPNHVFHVSLDTVGRWKDTQFQDFKFTSDYQVEGLKNQHRQYGLGVPLIAECKDNPPKAPGADYFPPNLTFALTAFLQVEHAPQVDPETNKKIHYCKILLYDPLEQPEIEIHGRKIPFEADISTPLAYLLDSGKVSQTYLATLGMLTPGEQTEQRGIYMLEPYDPKKIPVMMVHGLWSSPMTWLEMFNDLRAQPEIRDNYQFWFYLYPTGQPFWISAAQFRSDLNAMRAELDPQHTAMALDQMVLVGHSMGGLVSRMQTIESQNDFWHLVSDQPPSLLKGSPEDTEALKSVLFFEPNTSVRRVITMGTPHRGSDFANSTTRWLGKNLIALPSFVTGSSNRLIAENPGFFRNRDLLEISTSVDSLAPDSPVLPEILDAPKAPWVQYHTVIGVVDQDTWLGYFSGRSDGVVKYESAHLDEAISEKVVTADHNTVHRNPQSVIEVRRILREHVQQLRQEYYSSLQQPAIEPMMHDPVMPAGHLAPVEKLAPVQTNPLRTSIYTTPPSPN
ncbi:esterase/lipase family protein [Bremerella sp.]|uniref:esterase/lipase family protein n=1 Tax=Bremerella sp. TaxID=2795602 RepID=UPI00391C4774